MKGWRNLGVDWQLKGIPPLDFLRFDGARPYGLKIRGPSV